MSDRMMSENPACNTQDCEDCGGDGLKHGFTETRPGVGRLPCLTCNGSGTVPADSWTVDVEVTDDD